MRHYFVLLFLAVTLSCSAKQGVSQQTDNKHTFVVDENLPAPEKNFEILSGELIAKQWASENKVNKTIAYSFENEDLWTKTNINSAVTIIHEAEENTQEHGIVPVRSTETDYFENWLTNKYGNEYSGSLITTKTQNGVKMYLKKAWYRQ